MALTENRKPTQDERRTAILDVARQAFLEEGYSGTSMSRIANLVGGSKATLYSYFPSKKDLFVAVMDRETNHLFDEIFNVKLSFGEPRVVFYDLVHRSVTALLSDVIIKGYRLITAEAGRFPEITRAVYELAVRRGLERVALHFGQAMLEGALRPCDPLEAAQSFLDLTAGNLHTLRLWSAIENVTPEQIDAEARRITSVFLAAYGNDELSRGARLRTRP